MRAWAWLATLEKQWVGHREVYDGREQIPFLPTAPTPTMQGLLPEVLSSIIGDIYDCALQPEGWIGALVRINRAMDAAYTSISLANSEFAMPRMAGHSPWDPVKLKVLAEEYGVEGVPGLLEVAYGDVDTPRSTLHQMPQAAFYATPFYRNWAAPQGLRDACVMKFVHTADRVGMVASVTSAQRDMVTANERQFMALLSPHLRRAAMIGDLLNHQRVETSVFRHALDQLSAPVILVDAQCKILYANASAHSMLESGQLVRANGGVFSPTNPLMRAALADAVLRAAGQAGDLGSRGMGIPVAGMAYQAAGAAAVAYLLPLKHSAIRSAFSPAVAAIFIATALSHHAPPAGVLACVFDLTPSEARVMQMVGVGCSTAATAAELGVSETTVKTHLAKVYSKTGVTRQAQLVQLVSSLSSPVGSLNPAGVTIG